MEKISTKPGYPLYKKVVVTKLCPWECLQATVVNGYGNVYLNIQQSILNIAYPIFYFLSFVWGFVNSQYNSNDF